MDLETLTTQMAVNAERVRALVQGVSDEQARWRPSPTSWSILEIINHLFDEEREDFRVVLDHILHPDQRRPGRGSIDPQGWVTARRYNERDLDESIENFLTTREDSLAWLRGLTAPDWEATYEAPFGPMTAGDVMASWVVHDLLHMRQLVKNHYLFTTTRLEPYKVDYAGAWYNNSSGVMKSQNERTDHGTSFGMQFVACDVQCPRCGVPTDTCQSPSNLSS